MCLNRSFNCRYVIHILELVSDITLNVDCCNLPV